ncbi:MAG: cysteine--tRNA ligase, partial [bacterium]|nr:cysteine--tRNA ligase [bacterium]
DAVMPAAAERLEAWQAAANSRSDTVPGVLDEVRSCFDNDLDTPSAVAVIDDAASTGGIAPAAALLGVRL